MSSNFLNTEFFDLADFHFKKILEGLKPWESIAQISDFIKRMFDEKILVPNYKDRKDVFVGGGTIVHPSAEITGPAIIGKNCDIRHAAFLRENCVLGDGVVVGHAVEVKNSILLNGSAISHLCYVGDTIIGNKVNVSGGSIFANMRLDKKNIIIKTGEESIDTGLRKFGAAVGDGSMIGVNNVINPGTLLGKNNIVYPQKSVFGIHKNNEIIK